MKPPIKKNVYNFEEQKKLGSGGEERLDSFFSRWYYINEVPYELQKEGVDRFFVPRWGEVGFPRIVEYKTDFQETGKVYIETHSVIRVGQQQNVKGWLYTSKADWLIYFMARYETACILSFQALRESVVSWQANNLCQRRECINGNYKGAGLIVPLPLMLKASHAIFKVPYSFEF